MYIHSGVKDIKA